MHRGRVHGFPDQSPHQNRALVENTLIAGRPWRHASCRGRPAITDSTAQIFTEAKELLPGGVNSPVRAFNSVGGQPIVFASVKGANCFDVDGNKYIDYVGSWGPAIVGHANDEVLEATKAQMDKGCSYGAPCALEVRYLRVWASSNPGRIAGVIQQHGMIGATLHAKHAAVSIRSEGAQ